MPINADEIARMWKETEHLPVWVRRACRDYLVSFHNDEEAERRLDAVGIKLPEKELAAVQKDWNTGAECLDEIMLRRHFTEWMSV